MQYVDDFLTVVVSLKWILGAVATVAGIACYVVGAAERSRLRRDNQRLRNTLATLGRARRARTATTRRPVA